MAFDPNDPRDSNDMNMDDDEYRDAVKRWVRNEIVAGRLPPSWGGAPDSGDDPDPGQLALVEG